MRALSAVERLGPRGALGIVFAARPELRTRTKRALTAVGLMALTSRLRRSKRGSCRSQTNVVLTLSPYLMLEAPVALVVLLLARRRILGIVAGVWGPASAPDQQTRRGLHDAHDRRAITSSWCLAGSDRPCHTRIRPLATIDRRLTS